MLTLKLLVSIIDIICLGYMLFNFSYLKRLLEIKEMYIIAMSTASIVVGVGFIIYLATTRYLGVPPKIDLELLSSIFLHIVFAYYLKQTYSYKRLPK